MILQLGNWMADPFMWSVPLMIFGLVVALGLVYLIRIHIAWRMAKKRHRDPLGWILLSFFFSPLLTWIVLLIVGEDKSFRCDMN